MSARAVIANGLILSAAAFLMRTIGVSFNVYVSSQIGADGMGLLTLIMSVYSLAVTFAVSGVSLASTRLTAEALGRKNRGEIRRVMRACLIYSLVFGIATLAVIYFGSGFIGENLLGDKRTIISLKAFALSMPFVSMSSAMHGYFNALRHAVKSAGCQFFEQLVKIFATVTLFVFFSGGSLEYMCLAVIAGGTFAEILSCLAAFVLYRLQIKRDGGKGENTSVVSKILSISLPVALSSYLRTGLVTLEHLLIPRGLEKYGVGKTGSLATYGVLQAMALPIVLFPTAFLASFNMLLIPEIAKSRARGHVGHINYMCTRALRFTLVFAIGAAAVMICFSHELGLVIYDNAEASRYIRMLSPLIPVMYFDSAVDSVLKGLDEQMYNMKINIIDAATSAVLVYFLCPRIGIIGYVVTIFVSEIFNVACSCLRLFDICDIKLDPLKWFVMPFVCALGACSGISLLLNIIKADTLSASGLTFHISAAVVLYILLLCTTHTIDREDINWIRGFFVRREEKA